MLRRTVALLALLQGVWCLREPRAAKREVLGLAVPSGFSHCLFYDDFSDQPTGSLPSSSRWTLDLGTSYPGGPEHWGTGEIQTYTSDFPNIAITAHNTLRITPVRAYDGSWTSSRIETTQDWDFACKRGHRVRVEARIKLGDDPEAEQLGIWPAFWALGSEYRGNYQNWPSVGEIDILETLNGKAKVWHVVHCGVAPGGPCNEISGISHASEGVQRGAWHTIAWEVDRRYGGEETMSWFVDGTRQWTLAESDVNDSDAWSALAGNEKLLLLNVAVGGSFPDAVAGLKTPTEETVGGEGASMEVDYVAVYATWW
ncbi:Glucan endo-1,3-beta-glucosidase A1 [Tolypocladium ophioglossoides CBS 100239]|uniref:Glucan endo-1,3-beta-glucosidase A1 n=1 Tax=Tolypocladium ophioglossoides (strain CBS 100239) TaxID=1163406 RepID=A0A0L0NFK0_TOLOC|nr:Glucan endo-1,3-beta-glucosidase A1 [Tolypocladium ophioglossoides CBS 100239]